MFIDLTNFKFGILSACRVTVLDRTFKVALLDIHKLIRSEMSSLLVFQLQIDHIILLIRQLEQYYYEHIKGMAVNKMFTLGSELWFRILYGPLRLFLEQSVDCVDFLGK